MITRVWGFNLYIINVDNHFNYIKYPPIYLETSARLKFYMFLIITHFIKNDFNFSQVTEYINNRRIVKYFYALVAGARTEVNKSIKLR